MGPGALGHGNEPLGPYRLVTPQPRRASDPFGSLTTCGSHSCKGNDSYGFRRLMDSDNIT